MRPVYFINQNAQSYSIAALGREDRIVFYRCQLWYEGLIVTPTYPERMHVLFLREDACYAR